MATREGERISLYEGVPNLTSVGTSLGRIVRFSGHQEGVYTVLPHSLCVARLMPTGEGIYGLTHDMQENVTSDVPRPMKSAQHCLVEEIVYDRMAEAYGIPPMTAEVAARVKEADTKALVAEAYIVGYADPMYEWFSELELIPDQEAMRITRQYSSPKQIQQWMFEPEKSAATFVRAYRKYMGEAGLEIPEGLL
jgi:hypothetical protein